MKTSLLYGFVMAISIPGLYADTITVNSSAAVTFLDSGLTSTDFPAAFTAADFTAAQTGPAASVLTSIPFYIKSLPNAPAAEWIGVTSDSGTTTSDTALYAIPFDVPQNFFPESLYLTFAVDNELGDTNPGVYLNGSALPLMPGFDCCFNTFSAWADADAGFFKYPGINWLYFDDVNLGSEAGLIFSATITTLNLNIAPEPASIWLLGAGMIATAAALRRRRTRLV